MLIVISAGKLVEQRKHNEAAIVLEQYAQVSSPALPAGRKGLPSCILLIVKIKGPVGNC
jgi:hypothetical protein